MKNVIIFTILIICYQSVFSLETINLKSSDIETHVVNKIIPNNLGDLDIATYFRANLVPNEDFINKQNNHIPKDFYVFFPQILPRAEFLAKTLFRTVILGYDDISPAKVINNCIFDIKISEKYKMLDNVDEIFLKNTALSKISVVIYQNYIPKDSQKNSKIIYFSDFVKTSMLCDRSIQWLLKTFLIDKGYIAIDVKTGQTRYIPMAYENIKKFNKFVLTYSNIIMSIPKISLIIPFKEPESCMCITVHDQVPLMSGMSEDFFITAQEIYRKLRNPISFHLTNSKTKKTDLIILSEKIEKYKTKEDYKYDPWILNLDYINFSN